MNVPNPSETNLPERKTASRGLRLCQVRPLLHPQLSGPRWRRGEWRAVQDSALADTVIGAPAQTRTHAYPPAPCYLRQMQKPTEKVAAGTGDAAVPMGCEQFGRRGKDAADSAHSERERQPFQTSACAAPNASTSGPLPWKQKVQYVSPKISGLRASKQGSCAT
jgi:hypothetical protein